MKYHSYSGFEYLCNGVFTGESIRAIMRVNKYGFMEKHNYLKPNALNFCYHDNGRT